MISFPIVLELITQRLGDRLLVLGTGIVMWFNQLFTALNSYVLGIVLDGKRKIDVDWSIVIVSAVCALVLVLASISECTGKDEMKLGKYQGNQQDDRVQ